MDRPIRGRGGSRGAAQRIWGAGPVIFDIFATGKSWEIHQKWGNYRRSPPEMGNRLGNIMNLLGFNGQMAQALSRESTNYQVLHFPWPIVSAIGSNNTIRHDPIDVSK